MFGAAQSFVYIVLFLAVFVTQVVALVDAARRPADAFKAEGKLTKPIWLLILAICAALGCIALPPMNKEVGFLNLFAVVPAIVYLVDVRPRLQPYSRRRGSGGGSGGGRPGGW